MSTAVDETTGKPPVAAVAPEPPALSPRAATLRAFLALCERDTYATVVRDPLGFLAQSILQSAFYLFVFGRVLPQIGTAGPNYGRALLPGVISLTVVINSLQGVALPLVIEFSFTKEIEDRLLAPLPAWLVGVQKLVWAALRGVFTALLILPLGAVILPHGLQVGGANWAAFALLVLAGGLAGAAMGLVMGTSVRPQKINLVFAIVLTPLLFTGATFYPWRSLDSMRWFQVVTLLNPGTYVSEGLRGALTRTPHLGDGWIALGLVVAISLFTALGVWLFARRATD